MIVVFKDKSVILRETIIVWYSSKHKQSDRQLKQTFMKVTEEERQKMPQGSGRRRIMKNNLNHAKRTNSGIKTGKDVSKQTC